MSTNHSYTSAVSAVEEILNLVTETKEVELSKVDDLNNEKDLVSVTDSGDNTVSNMTVTNNSDKVEDLVIKEDSQIPSNTVGTLSTEGEGISANQSSKIEVNSQTAKASSTKEEFIQAIELSPTVVVGKLGDGQVELSKRFLHETEKKAAVEVHFDSPIASYHEYQYYVSQDTCESTQSLSDLTPIRSSKVLDVQHPDNSKDVGGIELQNGNPIFSGEPAGLMTPAGDCTTHELAAELTGTAIRVTPNFNDRNVPCTDSKTGQEPRETIANTESTVTMKSVESLCEDSEKNQDPTEQIGKPNCTTITKTTVDMIISEDCNSGQKPLEKIEHTDSTTIMINSVKKLKTLCEDITSGQKSTELIENTESTTRTANLVEENLYEDWKKEQESLESEARENKENIKLSVDIIYEESKTVKEPIDSIEITENTTSTTIARVVDQSNTVCELSSQESKVKPDEHCQVALESSPDLFESPSQELFKSPILNSNSDESYTNSFQNENSVNSKDGNTSENDENNHNSTSDACDSININLDNSVDNQTKTAVNVECSSVISNQLNDINDIKNSNYQECSSGVVSSQEKLNVTTYRVKTEEYDMDNLTSKRQTQSKITRGTIQQTNSKEKDGSDEITYLDPSHAAEDDSNTEDIICESVLIYDIKQENTCLKRSKSLDQTICSTKKIKTVHNEHESSKMKPKKRAICDELPYTSTESSPPSAKYPKLCQEESSVHITGQYFPKELKQLAAKVLSSLDEETEWENSAASIQNSSIFIGHHSDKQISSSETEKKIIEHSDELNANENVEQIEIVNEKVGAFIEKREDGIIEIMESGSIQNEQNRIYPFKFTTHKIDLSKKIDNPINLDIKIDNEINMNNEQSFVEIQNEASASISIDVVPQTSDNNTIEVDRAVGLRNEHSDGNLDNNQPITAVDCLSQSSHGSKTGSSVDQTISLEHQSSSQMLIQKSQEKCMETVVCENTDIPTEDSDSKTDVLQHELGDLEHNKFMTAMEYLSQSSQGSSTGFLVDQAKCPEPQSSSQESIQQAQEKYMEIAHSENAEIPSSDTEDLPEPATLSIKAVTKEIAVDANIDTEVLDSYVSRTIDDLVPDNDSDDEGSSDSCSLYQKEEENKDKQFYSCDVDMYDDTDKLVCSPVDKHRHSEPSTSSTSSAGCFKWKYAPSYHSDKPISDLDDEDKMVTITPIKTCNKPLRLGLSKKIKPLHSLHKF